MSEELTENEKKMAEVIALHIVREKQLTDALRNLVDECKEQDFECYSTGKRLIEEAESVL